MQLSLNPKVMLRTSYTPIDEQLDIIWDDFKKIIKVSSIDFYNVIKHVKANELAALDKDVALTLFKYFNRSKYRATPFGLFSSVSILSLAEPSDQIKIEVNGPTDHAFLDWSIIRRKSIDLETLLVSSEFLFSNPTFYQSGSLIKYLYYNGNTFELSSIDFDEIVLNTLNYLKAYNSIDQAIAFLRKKFDLTKRKSLILIRQLVTLQLIFCDEQAGVIDEQHSETKSVDKTGYALSTRDVLDHSLSSENFTNIQEAILILKDIMPWLENSQLVEFKKKFVRKYGSDSSVPLWAVLDPQTGLGYGEFELSSKEDDLINELSENCKVRNSDLEDFSSTYIQSYLNHVKGRTMIPLTDFKKVSVNPPPLPNTFSAIVTTDGATLHMQQAGGASANSIMGRFTILNGEFLECSKNLAKIEIDANTDVIFFDINYQAEPKIDNVNRRNRIYQYEFSINGFSNAANPIFLDEIQISVINDEIVLWSTKYNKRIVPRFGSAYNYRRSNLSLYRFFADIQCQGLRTSLTIDPQFFLPSMNFYPGIYYKNIVLSPSKWLVPNRFINKKNPDVFQQFKEWLVEEGIFYFRYGTADQKLLFNAKSDSDLYSFIAICKSNETCCIEAAPEPHSIVADIKKRQHFSEIILNFTHPGRLYHPLKKEDVKPTLAYPKFKHPLSGEWLYYEIYSHSAYSNDIICNVIKPFVSKFKNIIEKWFFIRYNEPEDHIRFRLKITSKGLSSNLTYEFSQSVAQMIAEGTVFEIILRQYEPELDKYSIDIIDDVEYQFMDDSRKAITLLQRNLPSNTLYLISIKFIEAVLNSLNLNLAEKRIFYQSMVTGYYKEYNLEKKGFKTINRAYKTFDFETVRLIDLGGIDDRLPPVLKVIKKSKEPSNRPILANLFHMHINRLFPSQQRLHEMIIYDYLLKRSRR